MDVSNQYQYGSDPIDRALYIASKLESNQAMAYLRDCTMDSNSLGASILRGVFQGLHEALDLYDIRVLAQSLSELARRDGAVNEEVLRYFLTTWLSKIGEFAENGSHKTDIEAYAKEVLLAHIYATAALRSRQLTEYVGRPGKEVRRTDGAWIRSGVIFGVAASVDNPSDVMSYRVIGVDVTVPYVEYVDRTSLRLHDHVLHSHASSGTSGYLVLYHTKHPLATLHFTSSTTTPSGKE